MCNKKKGQTNPPKNFPTKLKIIANGGRARKGRRDVGYRANANHRHWVLGLHNGGANRANAIFNDGNPAEAAALALAHQAMRPCRLDAAPARA